MNNLLSYEERVKICFQNTMKETGISDTFYSLDGYKEGASCITKQDGKWLVFDAERAEKYEVNEYTEIKDACLEVIKRFSYSEEDCQFLSDKFANNLEIETVNARIVYAKRKPKLKGKKKNKSVITLSKAGESLQITGKTYAGKKALKGKTTHTAALGRTSRITKNENI